MKIRYKGINCERMGNNYFPFKNKLDQFRGCCEMEYNSYSAPVSPLTSLTQKISWARKLRKVATSGARVEIFSVYKFLCLVGIQKIKLKYFPLVNLKRRVWEIPPALSYGPSSLNFTSFKRLLPKVANRSISIFLDKSRK